jgi:hypothetical protein
MSEQQLFANRRACPLSGGRDRHCNHCGYGGSRAEPGKCLEIAAAYE